jgi:hypothetical protein
MQGGVARIDLKQREVLVCEPLNTPRQLVVIFPESRSASKQAGSPGPMVGKRLLSQPVQRAALRVPLELPISLLGVESREPRAEPFHLHRGKLGDLLPNAFEAGHQSTLAGA